MCSSLAQLYCLFFPFGVGFGFGLGAAKQKAKRNTSALAKESGETQGELEQMKKKLKRTKDGHLLLTVGLTGARAGDTLEGCAEDTQVIFCAQVSFVSYVATFAAPNRVCGFVCVALCPRVMCVAATLAVCVGKGVVLRIASGISYAPAKIHRQIAREEVVTSIAKHFGLSRAIAELRFVPPPASP